MRKRFNVLILRRTKKNSGKALSKGLFRKRAKKRPAKRIQARWLAVGLSILIVMAVSVLHYLDYFPVGNRGFYRPSFARAVKTFVSSRVFPEQHEATEAAQQALQQRIKLLLGGNVEEIMDNYDLSGTSGTWAYENETNRIDYFSKWALVRNVRLVDVESTFEVDSVSKEDSGSYWIELTEHTFYAYEYTYDSFESTWILGMGTGLCGNLPAGFGIGRGTGCGTGANMLANPVSGGPSVRHEFGSRTVHVIEMVRVDDKWKIRKDWYMDPLGNNVSEPGEVTFLVPEKFAASTSYYEAQGDKPLFNRDKALEYAVKYSGVRALPDGGRYNSKYRIYTFAGGDCANFASQVLHAGGIPQGHGWHYTKEGSTAWVQSESLVWYLLSSGRGYRLFRGKFGEAVLSNQSQTAGAGVSFASVSSAYESIGDLAIDGGKPSKECPVDQLEPGDIIAYESRGQIYHVAVVVGKDPQEYVTIASHTADRLHFPWDLGWDQSTVFWFIKISY